MMCGVSKNKLIARLGLDSTIFEVVRQGNLSWLGHVVEKGDDDCAKQA